MSVWFDCASIALLIGFCSWLVRDAAVFAADTTPDLFLLSFPLPWLMNFPPEGTSTMNSVVEVLRAYTCDN